MGKHAAINKKSNNSNNPDRPSNGKGGLRSKSTIMRLNMYKGGKPVRTKEGKIIGGLYMSRDKAGGKELPNVARIAPDRRWFGNTRVISQKELENFREEVTVKEADPYSIILRRKKIPMALLQDSEKIARVNLLESESFDSIMGGKQTRKRPKMGNLTDYEALMNTATEKNLQYEKNPTKDSNIEPDLTDGMEMRKDDLFSKGQSKRIWSELYKVLDCSDVILQIVDARNVPGTRSAHIENHIKKNASHKHMVIIINKCDLVPDWVTRKWVKILSASFPTLAFHASLTNSFGKGALISLLRQFSKLHSDKRQISVGVIGYPNTGKSSVINALVGKKCCKAAPIPGETKVWQYIALMKRIFLIDCPGVVYDVGDDEVETVLKGVVRSERLENPADFITAILSRVKKEHLQRHYGLKEWTDATDFMSQLAAQMGRLLKGGEPDVNSIAKIMINDWQRGKLPYFVPPPRQGDQDEQEDDDHSPALAIANDSNENEEDGDGDDDEEEEVEEEEGSKIDNGDGGDGDDDSVVVSDVYEDDEGYVSEGGVGVEDQSEASQEKEEIVIVQKKTEIAAEPLKAATRVKAKKAGWGAI